MVIYLIDNHMGTKKNRPLMNAKHEQILQATSNERSWNKDVLHEFMEFKKHKAALWDQNNNHPWARKS